ncbi:MAG: UvrD-helicase domain-containing protein [Acidobacteriia bacterium]|nr:UvrD-helicase domain-containing protein [Terriglobia bacterium]
MVSPEGPSSLLNDLNSPQREAVLHGAGPLLILAGAGSGKTRVITYRIAYLIESGIVRPENILAVTFTNKAADQMKDRVLSLLQGRHASWPLICTFHSLCVRILRREIERLGYSRDFAIYDETDQESLMKACLKEVDLDSKSLTPRSVLSQISYAKNHGQSARQFYAAASDPRRQQVAVLFDLYERRLKSHNGLDFDDLLLRTVEVLGQFPDVRERYNQRFQHVLVDEYQDTNQIQYRLIRQLTELQQNLCVVGDEDQSIYRWRGADIRNILDFSHDYPQARLIKLEQNYRSTQVILNAASAVVSNNSERHEKVLWTERHGGELVSLSRCVDAESEAMFVAEQAQQLRASHPDFHSVVLYRTNAQSRVFEEVFRRYAIPYRMVGGFSFYDRAEIKDILSYLKLAVNPHDAVSLYRVVNTPPRGVGKSTVEILERLLREHQFDVQQALDHALAERALSPRAQRALADFSALMQSIRQKREELSLPELIRHVVECTGYRKMLEEDGTEEAVGRLENLNELANAAAEAFEREESLRTFLDHAALVSDQDAYDENAAISLMTMHSAKGLEFSVVFIVGLEEGLFPHSRSLIAQEELEEERRLFYVAMTRAKDRLFLTQAQTRRFYGAEASDRTEPSRFLDEIPREFINDLTRGRGPRRRAAFEGVTYDTPEDIQDYLNRIKEGNPASKRTPSPFTNPFKGSGIKKWKSKFALGSQVRHPKYGVGTVLRSEGQGEEIKLSINFPHHGLKKLMEKFADLEEV